MWRWLVCILRNLLPTTWLGWQNRWCGRKAPPIRLPTACTCSTCQQAPNRTLLSFPIPEDHKVDLPRNKCPAGDNTHGAPRVAPKSCPPKKQANHPPDKLPLSAKSFASIRETLSPPQTSNSQSFLGRAFWQPIARLFSLSDPSKAPSKKISENCSLMQRRLD